MRSESFKTPPIARVLAHPQVYSAVGHGCRFGVKHAANKLPLLKPTLWFSTSVEICEQLAKRCLNEKHPGNHVHGTCLGGNHVTEHTGRYTREIARAIHMGFVQVLKRKEPGRVRILLRNVSARIRERVKRCQGKSGDEQLYDLRWTEKSVREAIERWRVNTWEPDLPVQHVNSLREQLVLAGVTEVGASGSGDPSQPCEDQRQQPAGQQSRRQLRTGLESDGVSFEVPPGRHLDKGSRWLLSVFTAVWDTQVRRICIGS